MYSQISESWHRLYKTNPDEMKAKAIEWRRQHTITRVERPSRLDRARRLGYRAKQGFVVVRIKVGRGGMRRQRPRSGRRPKHLGVVRIKQSDNMRKVAERRVGEKYPNMQVIGSYFLYKDGKNYWFECILVDGSKPTIYKDRELRHRLGLVGSPIRK